MYGHALNLLPQCCAEGCTRAGIIELDDKTIMCAAHALQNPAQI